VQVTIAQCDEEVRAAAMNALEVIISCGFTKPVSAICVEDVPHLVKCVSLHATILVIKAELDQLVEGLAVTGVLEMMRRHPQLCRKLFVPEPFTSSKYSSFTSSNVISLIPMPPNQLPSS
jgi:hypothetical protein